jgi:hypothetical protein
MRGKIDKNGYLWKDVPRDNMRGFEAVRCNCAGGVSSGCNDTCVAFKGPLPEKDCTQADGDGTTCPGSCEKCEMFKPTGRTEIHYCRGILRFDEFVDERVK